MVQNPVLPGRYQDALRTPLALALLVVGLLLALALFAAALAFSYPSPDYFYPGLASDFPSSNEPYLFQEQGFFLVNTGAQLLALSDDYPNLPYCRIRWSAQKALFIEPCRGSRFTLTGLWNGNSPPATMSRYPVEIVDGQVRVDLSRREPGPP